MSIVNRQFRGSFRSGNIGINTIMAIGLGIATGGIGAAIGGGALFGIGFSPMFGLTGTQIGGMLGMMAGSTLANILFPAAKDKTPWPEMNEYPMQKATNGPPIQKVLGTRVIAGNFIWEGDLHSYQVKHSAGGGKGGGEEAAAYETQYRQSFLVDLGEGPAMMLRIWTGNKQIWPDRLGNRSPKITVFEGIDNQGIKDLTGEDYGEWPRNCCVFFEEWPLGNSPTKPTLTFEVGQFVEEYFVGTSPYSGNQIVAKAKADSTIDMDWGTSGYWDASPGLGPLYCMLQVSDGRLLVAHNYYKVTMINRDGTTDTTWATNGTYMCPVGSGMTVHAILEDNDGNFHLFGGVAGNTASHVYVKISSTGIYIGGLTRASTKLWYISGAVWANDAKTRIIASGQGVDAVGIPPTYSYPDLRYPNIVAINPSTIAVDTTWTGNVSGSPGYAQFPPNNSSSEIIYHVYRTSDDRFVIYRNQTKLLAKILSDGSALDTSWGTNGELDFSPVAFVNAEGHTPSQDGDEFYVISIILDGAVQKNRFSRVSSAGVITNTFTVTGTPSGGLTTYYSVTIFNDQLLLGHSQYVELWDKDFTYISRFSVANTNIVWWVIPDNENAVDMNFATMCRQVLTDTQWGAGFDAATQINETTFTATEDYCASEGLKGSIVLTEKKNWREWLDYICAHFGGFWYENGGQICLGVYKDETAVFDLSVANGDFIIEEGDNPPPPISVKDRDYSETYNRVIVSWIDRDQKYAQGGPTQANDETDQRISGQVREKTYDLSGIMTVELAQRMAYRLLIEAMYRFKSYYFRVPYKHMLLEVGDVGTISDGDQIVSQKVRIFRIEEHKNGRDLVIVAIEDISALYPTLAFGSQGSLRSPQSPITLADGTISFREDIEANQLYLCIAPGAATTNGWYIYRSYDNATYDLIGRCGVDGVTGGDANSVGTIQGFLPSHPAVTWAKDESVLVSIGVVTDLHTDISDDQFWNSRRLARIGDEIIAFMDAVETATPGVWQISNLRRGLFSTEPVAHYAGEAFATLDTDFLYRLSETDIGQTLYFKATAFYGDDTQSVADVSGFNVAIQGYFKRPAAAACLRLAADIMDGGSGDYSGVSFTLYWNLGARNSGLGVGGHDVNPAHPSWFYPDAESLLMASGGALFGNYLQDTELQKIVLRFQKTDGTLIGEREIAVAGQATITKATDLGGFNPAKIKVIPRRSLRAWDENEITVDDGT